MEGSMKVEARRLRKLGMSYVEISKILRRSKSTIRTWVADIKFSKENRLEKQREKRKEQELKRRELLKVDKEKLRDFIDSYGLYGATRRLGLTEGVSRYWAKEYNIPIKIRNRQRHNSCSICGKIYVKSEKHSIRCITCESKTRRLASKIFAIKFLGGKCQRCGIEWNRNNLAAFEFHHFNRDKEFSIGKALNASWKKIKGEISKCELLCSNCHRIEHSDYDNPKILEIAEKINKRR
jgi:transposase